MKKFLIISLLIAVSSNLKAEQVNASAPNAAPNAPNSVPAATAATAATVAAVATTATAALTTANDTTTTAAVTTPKKKLTFKQKLLEYWNKISNFDFQSLNIIGKTEKFVAGKKKQNLEAMEGVETGIWKHTKRMPTSGQAKEIADKLDKTTQEKIKKYDSVNSF